jgi:hypothetical protein
MSNELTGYELSRDWFDFCFENPELISPNHSAMFFFIIEHCNRLGWKKKFGLPATMTMDAIGIKSYNTYKKTFNDVVAWGFRNMVQVSKNQYSSNIIALSKFNKALDKALDKAMIKHLTKQSESTVQSKESIDKHITLEPITIKTNEKILKNGFNTRPKAEDYNGLPENHIKQSIELIKITKKINVTKEQVLGMWEVFKISKLTGNEYYPNEGKIYSHYIDWLKFQKFENLVDNNSDITKNMKPHEKEQYLKLQEYKKNNS